jgi:hypothetical protein
VVIAPDSTGKTTLACQYTKCRVGLLPPMLLGEPVEVLPADQRVLYICCDRPLQILQAFRRGLTGAERAVLKARVEFHFGGPPRPLTTRAGHRWLLAKIERANAGMLVLDSLKDLVDTMDPQALSQLNDLLRKIDAMGVEVLILHHPTEASEKKASTALSDAKGLREVYSGSGSALEMKPTADKNSGHLHHLKAMTEVHPTVHYVLDRAAGQVLPATRKTVREAATANAPAVDHKRVRLRLLFDQHAGADGWVPAKPLGKELGRLDRAFAGYLYVPDPKHPEVVDETCPIEHNGARGAQSLYRWVEVRPKPLPEGVIYETD